MLYDLDKLKNNNTIRKCKASEFIEEDDIEVDQIISGLRTKSSSFDEESQKEILKILRKPKTCSSISLRYSSIKAPIAKKSSCSFLIERVSRPFSSWMDI